VGSSHRYGSATFNATHPMRTYFLYLDTQPADPVKEADVRRVVEKA
jgi:hypothetical protein